MSESSSSPSTPEETSYATAEHDSSESPSSTSITTNSSSKTQSTISSLSSIIPSLPPSLHSSQNPASSILEDPHISAQITSLLRDHDSGAGDNNLCRWFYDTFQSSDPGLQLLVLRFLPIIAGLYLCRVSRRKPLAGFEAILLALYAHETASRNGQPVTVNVPDLSHPSIYHETTAQIKNNATELNLAVISPSLEPHGTVRSTKRARIVGVALELYYSKIPLMPAESKIDFCEFVKLWSGHNGGMYKECNGGGDGGSGDKGGSEENGESWKKGGKEEEEKEEEKEEEGGRIPLPWELLQPVMRILGHCLLGPEKDKKVFDAAYWACRSLYARCLHDLNSKVILATGSLLRLSKMALDPSNDIDHTELPITNIITLS